MTVSSEGSGKHSQKGTLGWVLKDKKNCGKVGKRYFRHREKHIQDRMRTCFLGNGKCLVGKNMTRRPGVRLAR